MSLHSPQFAAQLNTNFRTQLEDGNVVQLELINVENRVGPSGYECFSVYFRAPNEVPIQQRTFSLQHEELGERNLFLVPISQDESGIVFEAVFNRLLD